jgi:hypothetical protein
MVAMGMLPTAMIPTSLARSDLLRHRLPLFRVAKPLECPHILTTLPSVHLPPASATLRGLHELIPRRLSIETLDVKIVNGIVNAAAGICKSIPVLLPLISCLVPESTPLLIAVIAPVPVLLVTIAHLSHLQGPLINRPLADRILLLGPRVNLLRLDLLPHNHFLSLIRLVGMIPGTMAEIPEN